MIKEEYLEKRIEILEFAVSNLISHEKSLLFPHSCERWNFLEALQTQLVEKDNDLEARFKNDNTK